MTAKHTYSGPYGEIPRGEFPTLDQLRVLFKYDSMTGIVSRAVQMRAQYPGEVGNLNRRTGYLTINICNKKIRVHRLAYALYHGQWPDQIDHVNGIKTDNRIINLRECTSLENKRNAGIGVANKSGFKGVYKRRRDGLFIAAINVCGKQKFLGSYKDAIEAARAYDRAALEEFGTFARPNHA